MIKAELFKSKVLFEEIDVSGLFGAELVYALNHNSALAILTANAKYLGLIDSDFNKYVNSGFVECCYGQTSPKPETLEGDGDWWEEVEEYETNYF